MVCPACQFGNKEGAKRCWACDIALPVAPHQPALSVPSPIPNSLRNRISQLLKRPVGENESAFDVLMELVPMSEEFVGRPISEPIPSELRSRVGRLLNRTVTENDQTGDLLSALVPLSESLAGRPAPAPMPNSFRVRVENLLNRRFAEHESAPEILAALIPHAEELAGRSVPPEMEGARTQLGQALGRQINQSESLVSLVEELNSKLKTAQIPPVLNPPPLAHSEIHSLIENLLGQKIQAGDQAKVLQGLAEKFQVGPAAPDVSFPVIVSKVLTYLPSNFRWVAAMVVPFVIGGGSGFLSKPDQKKQLVETQIAQKSAEDRAKKSSEDLISLSNEIEHLSEDNRNLRKSLSSEQWNIDQKLEESHQKIKMLQENLVATNAKSNSLRALATRGFVDWHGTGGGALSFTAESGPTRGEITEGVFPKGNCEIVEINSSDVDKPQSFKGQSCFQQIPFQIKGRPGDNKDKRVLIVWRQK